MFRPRESSTRLARPAFGPRARTGTGSRPGHRQVRRSPIRRSGSASRHPASRVQCSEFASPTAASESSTRRRRVQRPALRGPNAKLREFNARRPSPSDTRESDTQSARFQRSESGCPAPGVIARHCRVRHSSPASPIAARESGTRAVRVQRPPAVRPTPPARVRRLTAAFARGQPRSPIRTPRAGRARDSRALHVGLARRGRWTRELGGSVQFRYRIAAGVLRSSQTVTSRDSSTTFDESPQKIDPDVAPIGVLRPSLPLRDALM